MEISDPRIDPRYLPEGSAASIINGSRHEYLDLPSVVTPDGRVISRWTPTLAEREAMARGEDIYVTVYAGRGPQGQITINPLFVSAGVCDWRMP